MFIISTPCISLHSNSIIFASAVQQMYICILHTMKWWCVCVSRYLLLPGGGLLTLSLSLYTSTGTGALCHILWISHQSFFLLGPFSSCGEDSSSHMNLLQLKRQSCTSSVQIEMLVEAVWRNWQNSRWTMNIFLEVAFQFWKVLKQQVECVNDWMFVFWITVGRQKVMPPVFFILWY
jgi:hypothetical protein